ncbi:MAG: hypothetical protein ACYTG2_14620 [Planctomycetota bacterium]
MLLGSLLFGLPGPALQAQEAAETPPEAPAPLPRGPQDRAVRRAGQGPSESEAARAFATKLKKALALEAEVQAYEQATLGLEKPETLNGYRLERRLRLDEDKAANERGRSFAVLGLIPPRPGDFAHADLGRRELTLLTNLDRAYEASRSHPLLDQFVSANRSFLSSADWALRDRAVILRDKLVARETAFTSLIEQAKGLLEGTVDAARLSEMEELLAEIAPETREATPDLSVLVIEDQDLRLKILAELQVMLAQQPGPEPPPPLASKLLPRVTAMQAQVVERANLAPVIQEHMWTEAELVKVEAEIEAGADSDDLEARKAIAQRKAELVRRHNELNAQWFGTDPDPTIYPDLIKDQDLLIQRMMLDLGPRGALFGARYDVVRQLAATETATTQQRWTLLQEQQDLIASLQEARPEPDRLDGMLPLATLVKARPPPPAEPDALGTGKPKASGWALAGGGGKAGGPKAAPKPKKKTPPKKKKSAPKKPGGGKKPR